MTVRALKAATRISTPALCEALGMSRTTWFSRMKGETAFTVGEAAAIADLFGCPVGDLFAGVVKVNATVNLCYQPRLRCVVPGRRAARTPRRWYPRLIRHTADRSRAVPVMLRRVA